MGSSVEVDVSKNNYFTFSNTGFFFCFDDSHSIDPLEQK